jgi:hypothetical protein
MPIFEKLHRKTPGSFILQGVLYCLGLFNFRRQIPKQIAIVKIYNTQIQSVTQFLYRNGAHIPALRLQHTIYGGGRYPCQPSKLGIGNAPLCAELPEAFRNRIFDFYALTTFQKVVISITICTLRRVRTCVLYGFLLNYFQMGTALPKDRAAR